MAHMSDGKGPYPDKAGEFCGNHHPGTPPMQAIGEGPFEAAQRQSEWLSIMRFGKPSSCEAGSSWAMSARGWVGLYLKRSRALFSWETPVETDELTERMVSHPRFDS